MTGNEITVTILVDDQPGSYTFENSTKVEEILKHLLPKEEKENWTQYELEVRHGGEIPLDVTGAFDDRPQQLLPVRGRTTLRPGPVADHLRGDACTGAWSFGDPVVRVDDRRRASPLGCCHPHRRQIASSARSTTSFGWRSVASNTSLSAIACAARRVDLAMSLAAST